tara:strand:- start:1767 stop:2831 length:1065 start_codon:yes stop_codon:yes gene_type:complete
MCTPTPIRVKFLSRGNRKDKQQLWLRQFPDNEPLWGNCLFIFDEDCTEYDWLVVYDDLPPAGDERFSMRKELLKCNRENTLLVTSEPSTIKVYGKKFLQQFGHVLTTQEPWAIKHKNAIYSQCGYIWYYGVGSNHVKNWNEIATNIPRTKNHSISTVCSAKKQKNTVHSQRFEFTQQLKKAIPELAIFGHGVQPIDDKADAIDTFKYHVVIENVSHKNHWSEKLADAFLGHAMPFYYGCTNLHEYFPCNSYIAIDPYDIERSIQTVKESISSGAYEKHQKEISEARKLVLHKYNFFPTVADIIQKNLQSDHKKSREPTLIKSRRSIRIQNPLNTLEYFTERYSVKFRHWRANKK